jgi:drug/metabolite transporter (DMT)-like permease
MLAIIILYAVSASTFLISKSLLIYSTPLFLSGLRTLIAGIIFFLFLKDRKTIEFKNYIVPCLIIGFFSFFMSNTLRFWALQYLTSEQSALIAISEPLFAILFAYLICSEITTIKQCVGLLLCMLGAASATPSFNLFLSFSLPTCVLFLSIVSSSLGALLMRKFIRFHNYSPTIINCISMASAGICALTTSFVIEDPLHKIVTAPPLFFLIILAIMILVSNIFSYSLYGKLVKQYSAVLISSASLLRPFFVALYSGNITIQMLFSFIIILFGLIIIYYAEKPLERVSHLQWHTGCQ